MYDYRQSTNGFIVIGIYTLNTGAISENSFALHNDRNEDEDLPINARLKDKIKTQNNRQSNLTNSFPEMLDILEEKVSRIVGYAYSKSIKITYRVVKTQKTVKLIQEQSIRYLKETKKSQEKIIFILN